MIEPAANEKKVNIWNKIKYECKWNRNWDYCVDVVSPSLSVPSIWKYEFPFHYSYMPCISIRCRFGKIFFLLCFVLVFSLSWIRVRLIVSSFDNSCWVFCYAILVGGWAEHSILVSHSTPHMVKQTKSNMWNETQFIISGWFIPSMINIK